MATVGKRQYTPEDLLRIHNRTMPELVDGELWERAIGFEADTIAAKIGRITGYHTDSQDLGLIAGSKGSYQIFPDHPDRVRIPDVSFIKKGRIDRLDLLKGHCRIVPNLVVKVISPKELAERLQSKVEDFLSAGVPLIWVVYPKFKFVRVHRVSGQVQDLRVGEFLDGGDVLPGFRCDVAELFD